MTLALPIQRFCVRDACIRILHKVSTFVTTDHLCRGLGWLTFFSRMVLIPIEFTMIQRHVTTQENHVVRPASVACITCGREDHAVNEVLHGPWTDQDMVY